MGKEGGKKRERGTKRGREREVGGGGGGRQKRTDR